ncbi:MAG: tRNA uridine-5-carboxymethylaminomethyl(34) synthesis GTPase MnmE [Raineya sp.]|nr:tRNA uridine-5-carboxymethylaminomethyl(34) synthesis GTPase MnmE [Raineya sp.]
MAVPTLSDTIVAPATPAGVGAIAVIRVSGKNAIEITDQIFFGKDLTQVPSHTLHFGTIQDENGEIIDEVLVSVFREPHSFTRENCTEISCHGSPYIVEQILKLLLAKGARMAEAGEFTKRAFLNGRFDLTQAEAVADLIAADSQAAHRVAMQQMRGGFSKKIQELRNELIRFASLVELELDFAEEDVEFANRNELKTFLQNVINYVSELLQSFAWGNVLKNGIPTAIVGKPNAGKSTLLNALLQEEKAIVSDIAGTTRDIIEDEMLLEGIRFRFIDTAGLRDTQDVIEAIGVERAKQKMQEASLVLYLVDSSEIHENLENLQKELQSLQKPYFILFNKIDKLSAESIAELEKIPNALCISAKEQQGIEKLKNALTELVKRQKVSNSDIVVSNVRHYKALSKTQEALQKVLSDIDTAITTDLLAADIRQAIRYLGEIIGEVSSEDLLDYIFSKFCIGK